MGNFDETRKRLLAQTKSKVAASVTDEQLIIQAVTSLQQLEQATNRLVKKAREWYGLLDPEFERSVQEHVDFLDQALSGRATATAMGGTLSEADAEAILTFLRQAKLLYEEKERLGAYVEAKMRGCCPNMTILAGSRIGAELLSHAGSLQRLATMPSGTLQLLGAEMALFRHLKDKRRHRSPKYGLIFKHPLVQKVSAKERGKAARSLADKLSICARIDLFKGETQAEAYKEALAKRFGEW